MRKEMSFALAIMLLAVPAQAQIVAAHADAHATDLLSRPALLEIEDSSLPEGLAELQHRSGVPLAYSSSLMRDGMRVTCRCARATVGQALAAMLAGSGFVYEPLRNQILIRPARVQPAVTAVAETTPIAVAAAPRVESSGLLARIGALFRMAPGTIRGRVTDAATSEPVGQVQVFVTGTSLGTLTGNDGTYTIQSVPAGLYTVEARRLGYADATRENIVVRDDEVTTVDLVLRITALMLDEVVVTGVADPTSARRVPFTVARVSGDRLQVPAQNAVNAIQGKVAGVNIVTNAQPGSGVNILLRSPTSINKTNSPLIVVDGVILATTFGRASTDLDALDIESIEVVKGAAAASLYGSRAANGVLQIRTRRGADLGQDQTSVTVRTEFGRNSIAREIGLSAHHHYRTNAAGEYVDANGNIIARENRVERPVAERFLDVPYSSATFDHVEQFFEPGTFQIHSLSIGRNSQGTNFLASYGRHDVQGVVMGAGGYEQNDVRLNLDHRLAANLSFSFSGYHMRSTRNNLPDDTFLDLVQQAPDVTLLNEDPDGTPFEYLPDPQGVTTNPLYAIAVTTDDEKRARTLASADLRWSPAGFVSLEGNLSYDRSDRLQRYFFPRGKKTDESSQVGGLVRRASGLTTALNGSATAAFRGAVGDLSARLTVRTLFEAEDYEFFNAEAASLSVENVPDLNAGTIPDVTGNTEEIRSRGYFVLGALDYRGRYILDGLVRRDGSSLFGEEERWHTYFRASGAWRMAEEDWWSIDAVDEFKLRYSIGTAGGRPSYEDRYETYSFSASGGLEKETLGNRFLKPERATEQEFGIDAIIADRFSVQLTHARVKTEDQLVLVPLPAGFGFQSQWQNAGTVEGHTWEATIEATLIEKQDLRWSIGVVADRSRHEVTEFDRSCFRDGPDNAFFRCEGETLGTMYGQQFLTSAAQLPASADPSEYQVNDDGLLVWVGPGGDWREAAWGAAGDLDGRTVGWGLPILEFDETGNPAIGRIGDSNPDLHLGFLSSLTWKDFSLFGLLDAQIGGDIYNRVNQRMYQYFRSSDTDQAGRPEAEKKTTDYYTTLYSANLINSWFVESAGYLKLRELSLRWRVPQNAFGALETVGLDDLTLFLVGRNVFTVSDYKGYDPEVGTPLSRFDDYAYPHYRTLTLGAQIRF